ncbi:MAG: response regulator [Rhizobiaceae bacterium]
MPKQTRILAVDDDVNSAELIVRVAERCGYEGFATSDSRGVANLTNALEPDVIAIDVNMPNIDARGLLELLSQAGYKGHIIVASGAEMTVLEETQAFGIEKGLSMPFVLQKPVDFQKLRKQLMDDKLKTAA